MMLLKINNLCKSFGGLSAVLNFNLEIRENELIGLIGPNGAGKTTVFNLITGVYKPDAGEIIFKGENIGGLPPYVICQKGIARTFQNIRLFNNLTVMENVKIALHKNVPYSLPAALFRLNSFYRGEKEIEEEAIRWLKLFNLDHRREEIASSLPYGEQRRLEIARALATHPTLLILDEPAAGMNPNETLELMELIRRLRDEFKLAILLIEHDMSLVMGVCERIYVLDYGQVIAEGKPEEIRNNKRVIEAYLGEEV
ncbi:amino acid/amide ABC transporter ATP-binding protein 1, HAAT family [Thermosyntropha lipolytica DSM 11003]|uniref:Amino acid/amide ABC transporter ATP-binding protein 1, HAAT family n=1 Tax=Thermosyntropha lipolytica DSM 11003 TaxID=1123382 RepID=A0A1M5QW11_9FIRM|nr:ABC transporter ATP-binding protein [Thermosyntropha lipolytica]SHH18367.1 amino acid/amide ABC transporter ATP-binding protein 1, HAAT family [Thermosyntropha lipolytica DSM 11003]